MLKKASNNTSLLDLLFNFLLATMILLVIAVCFIIVEQNKADIKTKAEFVITIDWDGEQNNDVDIWILDPQENLLWYREKEIGVMHLDRDDLGHLNDYQVINGESVPIKVNQEIVTIRGVVEGEWVINLHLYRQSNKNPTNTTISLIKLNPKATIIFSKKLELKTYWKQITVARIFMTNSGEILKIEDGPFRDLIQDRVAASHTSTNVVF